MRRSQGRDHVPQFAQFMDEGFIDEVLGLIKTGKEASVYCCRGGPAAGHELVAAKVYRGRQYRFKNDAVYQQARVREMGLPPRVARALARKSGFGRQMQAATWHNHEYETLRQLYEAGADVPRPLTAGGDVILMQYFGDEDGPAPQLNRVELEADEARRVYGVLLDNIELWLACNRVHGDLSPHNILYWHGEVRVIDFPQATDPRFNSSARELLTRDVENVCRYFASRGIEADGWEVANELWRRFTFGLL